MPSSDDTLDIVVVGGSLAGLMNGIVLHRLGHNVQILEKTSTEKRESQAAGITLGVHTQTFFSKHDLCSPAISLPCSKFRVFNADGTVKRVIDFPRRLTSWDALHSRLRTNFDGFQSGDQGNSGITEDIRKAGGSGEAIYHQGKRVIGVGISGSSVLVTWEASSDSEDEISPAQRQSGVLEADLVIAADGASSTVKRFLEPLTEEPVYAGYVAWRGTVPEDEVSAPIRDEFQGHIASCAADGEYILVYHIPGPNTSLTPGSRLLNFVYYTPVTPSSLPNLLTDIHGVTHRRSLAVGLLRPEIWEAQKEHARHVLSPQFLSLLDACAKPFLQTVDDKLSERAVLQSCSADLPTNEPLYDRLQAGGKVVSVGEALVILRPHTAQAVDRIAQAALWLGEAVGEANNNTQKRNQGVPRERLVEWERKVIREARWAKGFTKAFGLWMMFGLWRALGSVFALGGIWVRKRFEEGWESTLKKVRRREC